MHAPMIIAHCISSFGELGCNRGWEHDERSRIWRRPYPPFEIQGPGAGNPWGAKTKSYPGACRRRTFYDLQGRPSLGAPGKHIRLGARFGTLFRHYRQGEEEAKYPLQ